MPPGCACRSSRCLKRYCVCFNAGGACSPSCACISCGNEDAQAPHVRDARRKLRFRQPQVGCKCVRSNCRRGYCECFSVRAIAAAPSVTAHALQAGAACTPACECKRCSNALPFQLTGAPSTPDPPDGQASPPRSPPSLGTAFPAVARAHIGFANLADPFDYWHG
jgi:Tesmin/TSO1-like CXC domain, cysteine-rich domain